MCDGAQTRIPNKCDANLSVKSSCLEKTYIERELATEGKQLSMISKESFETTLMYVDGDNIGA
jgi:hypothetical protein